LLQKAAEGFGSLLGSETEAGRRIPVALPTFEDVSVANQEVIETYCTVKATVPTVPVTFPEVPVTVTV
jgi:hypothetical protein